MERREEKTRLFIVGVSDTTDQELELIVVAGAGHFAVVWSASVDSLEERWVSERGRVDRGILVEESRKRWAVVLF